MKKLSIIILMVSLSAQAQDVHFSQYVQNPLQLSPAMIGANHDLHANVSYKDQWRKLGSPYKTFAASYDMRLNKRNGNSGYFVAGVNFFTDNAGDSYMKSTNFNVNFGYQLFLNDKNMLGAAIQGGWMQRSTDLTNLTWSEQYDGFAYNPALNSGEGFGQYAYGFGDLGFGLVWSYKENTRHITQENPLSLNVGIGAYHLLKPDYSFLNDGTKLYRKITAFATSSIYFKGTSYYLEPSVFYSRQGPTQEIYIGTYGKYQIRQSARKTGLVGQKAIALGVFFRTKDAVVAALRYDIANYSIGVSYDINISQLSPATAARGGIEFSLRFVMPNPFGAISRSRL